MISGVTELVFESVAEREKKEEVVSVLVYALEVTFIFRFIFCGLRSRASVNG